MRPKVGLTHGMQRNICLGFALGRSLHDHFFFCFILFIYFSFQTSFPFALTRHNPTVRFLAPGGWGFFSLEGISNLVLRGIRGALLAHLEYPEIWH